MYNNFWNRSSCEEKLIRGDRLISSASSPSNLCRGPVVGLSGLSNGNGGGGRPGLSRNVNNAATRTAFDQNYFYYQSPYFNYSRRNSPVSNL